MLDSSDKLKLKVVELQKSDNEKEQLGRSADQFNMKISELEKALEVLKDKNNVLLNDSSSNINEIEDLKASNVSLKSQVEILEDEYSSSKTERNKLTIKCDNFENEIEGLNSKLLMNEEETKARCAILEGEVDSLQSLLKSVAQNSVQNENEDIKNEEIKILSVEKINLLEKLKILEVEINKINSEYEKSQDRLDALTEETNFLNNIVITFEKKEIDMKSDNEKIANENNAIILELEELKNKSDKKELLRKKLSESEEKYVALVKEKHLLESDLSVCEERILEGDGRYKAKEEELRVYIEKNEIEVMSRVDGHEGRSSAAASEDIEERRREAEAMAVEKVGTHSLLYAYFYMNIELNNQIHQYVYEHVFRMSPYVSVSIYITSVL